MVPSPPLMRLVRLFHGTAGAIRAGRAYLAAAGLSIFAAIFLLELPGADLRVPFDYSGDALLYSGVVKSIVDHGWFWTNPSLGAPGGLQLYDYPNVAHESLHVLAIKLMSAFSGDWALLINIYFLLGFPLIALSAMAVFRQFEVSDSAAIVGSVLYSFLPGRLIKGEGHLFLDVFFQVPLSILVILWVCGDAPPLVRPSRDGGGLAPDQRRRRTVAALLICALSACTSAYYSFFTICLLVAGGIWASIERRSIRNAMAGTALAAVIVVAMAANGLPSTVYQLRHGPNPEVGLRGAGEAEVFGLKIAQLLLPAEGHRVSALRRLGQRYHAGAPRVGDSTASLGLIGAVGFLALLGVVVLSRRRSQRSPDDRLQLLSPLAALNLGALLLGTIGGFGSLIALVVFPQIRAYSRISVFIGFFSLFAVVLLLDRLKRGRPLLAALALPVALAVGLLDQSTARAVRPYAAVKKAFTSDRDLIRGIEARVPAGTMVFELPYQIFPEWPPLHHLFSYDLLRPYLHSSALRWSLPTMHGRSGESFVREVSRQEPGQILETVAAVGFGGILINRDGYADDGAKVEAGLRAGLGAEPLVSQDGRLVFFDLTDYRRRLPTALSPAEIERMLRPLTVSFARGCYGEERVADRAFRWCMRAGDIRVSNDGGGRRRLAIKMTLFAAQSPARLTIDGDLISEVVGLEGATRFTREIDVPPGDHSIRIRSDGRPADAPDDPRRLVWRVEDFSFEELLTSPEGSR